MAARGCAWLRGLGAIRDSRPGLLMSLELVDELLGMMADGIARAEHAERREGEGQR